MKKKERVARKRIAVENRKATKRHRRWAQKMWPFYRKGLPFNTRVTYTLKAKYGQFVGNLNQKNPFLEKLKKIPDMTGEVFYEKIPIGVVDDLHSKSPSELMDQAYMEAAASGLPPVVGYVSREEVERWRAANRGKNG